ncbi:MAG: hypothetical protein ACLTWV_14295 [Intestinibacter bartlettii]
MRFSISSGFCSDFKMYRNGCCLIMKEWWHDTFFQDILFWDVE